MIVLTLPDGSARRFDGPVTGGDLARSIGPGLGKAALAVKVDGIMQDVALPISTDAKVEIVTRRSPEALELLRHDAAHVMAEAVQELYPGTQITFGPAIENGFYYDFARADPFTPDDFPGIEERMREIVDRDEPIVREVWTRAEAIRYFAGKGETFKAEHVGTIPDGEAISIYRQGEFVDLCTGPHLPSTGKLGKAFKLMKTRICRTISASSRRPSGGTIGGSDARWRCSISRTRRPAWCSGTRRGGRCSAGSRSSCAVGSIGLATRK
jgi:threonyl-tRNA synthetase